MGAKNIQSSNNGVTVKSVSSNKEDQIISKEEVRKLGSPSTDLNGSLLEGIHFITIPFGKKFHTEYQQIRGHRVPMYYTPRRHELRSVTTIDRNGDRESGNTGHNKLE